MLRIRSTNRLAVATLAVLLSVACDDDDDPARPMDEVAGAYGASEFRIVEGAEETDILAQGGYIEVLLTANGAWTGSVFAPGAAEDGGDLDVDLEGTWQLDDGTVVLDHEVDFFLRDIVFEYDDGTRTLSGSCCMTPRIYVTLDRIGLD